jgi:CubicO group peptidase (beta-lactamase class C family)
MTFSVAKSYLALLAGLALGDGLIKSLDDKAGDYALDDGFKSDQNKDVTWRHLLTQTSEWSGSVFGKEDRIDHNRRAHRPSWSLRVGRPYFGGAQAGGQARPVAADGSAQAHRRAPLPN